MQPAPSPVWLMLAASIADTNPTQDRYVVQGDEVFLCGSGKPVRLSEESREELLSIFMREGAAREFNSLHEAHVKAGGVRFS